jgi:hypothetical protein
MRISYRAHSFRIDATPNHMKMFAGCFEVLHDNARLPLEAELSLQLINGKEPLFDRQVLTDSGIDARVIKGFFT